jgi:hypothetical protein
MLYNPLLEAPRSGHGAGESQHGPCQGMWGRGPCELSRVSQRVEIPEIPPLGGSARAMEYALGESADIWCHGPQNSVS